MDKNNLAVSRKYGPQELLDNYSQIYLDQYWPEAPNSAIGWADNAVLMLAYQDAAIAANAHFGGRAVRLLDISTGPALAPLLTMVPFVKEVQLSDFNYDNRNALQKMEIGYWHNYVPMLTKIFRSPEEDISEILSRLDTLRLANFPIEVDLFRDQPLPSSICPFDFDLISMNFVADGITETEADYLRCLGKVTDMVRPEGAFIMSAVVDSNGWHLGNTLQPSPNVSEKTILDFLASQGFKILNLSRSMRLSGLTYSGGWIVLAAARVR